MTDKDRTLEDIISDITEQELAEKCPDVVITRDQLHQKIKKHRKRRLKKPVAFAVIAAVLVLGFIALWPMLSPNDIKADADKNAKEEILTDDGVIIEDKGWGSSSEDGLTITEWDDIPIAKIHVEELLVPEYIPEGYEFEELKVETVEDLGTTCCYKYKMNNKSLEISEHISSTALNSIEIDKYEDIIISEKGKIYIRYEDEKIIAIIVINDGISVTINGILDISEITEVIENLE